MPRVEQVITTKVSGVKEALMESKVTRLGEPALATPEGVTIKQPSNTKTPLEKTIDPIEARATSAQESVTPPRRTIEDHEGVSGMTEGKQVGHAILKHVGKSEKWLQNRIVREGVESASSFHNKTVGNRTIGRFKKQYEAEINQWLKSKDTDPFEATIDMDENIGLVVNANRKGTPLAAEKATKAKIVLVKDNSEHGWHLFTVKLQK